MRRGSLLLTVPVSCTYRGEARMHRRVDIPRGRPPRCCNQIKWHGARRIDSASLRTRITSRSSSGQPTPTPVDEVDVRLGPDLASPDVVLLDRAGGRQLSKKVGRNGLRLLHHGLSELNRDYPLVGLLISLAALGH